MMAMSDHPARDPRTPFSFRLTRRELLRLVGAAGAIGTVMPTLPVAGQPATPNSSADHPGAPPRRPRDLVRRYVYVGTYTAPFTAPGGTQPSTAVGIYIYKMEADGGLTLVQIVPAENPSFLAIDPTNTHVYSTNELGLGADNVTPLGRVSAYAINAANGNLSFLNTVPTNGTFPAHLSVHPSGKHLLASNYGTGNFPIYEILSDGQIGPMTDDFQDVGNGTGPNPGRQEGPHAHMILTDPGAGHAFGVDLGADKVMAWTFDVGTGKLTPNTVPFANVASGAGCRHMAFHPTRQLAYVLNELVSSIDAFSYDPERGAFIWLQTVSTLPPRFTGTSTTAEIRVHPDGKFVYATNRGHNSVAIFEVDQDNGKLNVIGWESTRGAIPRGMNIDPSGTFLYAANQNSDTIVIFRINLANGKLIATGDVVNSPTPVDVEFGPPV
jgi:6-phosphogluconolactonase